MTASNERCAVRRDELSAYHDKALAPADAAAMADHVARCRDCQEHLASFAEVDRAILSLAAPESSPAEREALVARVAALRRSGAGGGREEKSRARWPWLTPRVLAPLAAAAVVLVVVLRVGDRPFTEPVTESARLRDVAPEPAPPPTSSPATGMPVPVAPPQPASDAAALARSREESAARTDVDQSAGSQAVPSDAKSANAFDEMQSKRDLAVKESETSEQETDAAKLAAEPPAEGGNAAAGGRRVYGLTEPKSAEESKSRAAQDQSPPVAMETPAPEIAPSPEMTALQKEKGTSGAIKQQEHARSAMPAPAPSPPPVSSPAPVLATDFRTAGSAIDAVRARLRAGDLPGARVALERLHAGALPESLAVEASRAGFEVAERSAEAADCQRAAALADTVLGRFPAAAAADSLRAARDRLPCSTP